MGEPVESSHSWDEANRCLYAPPLSSAASDQTQQVCSGHDPWSVWLRSVREASHGAAEGVQGQESPQVHQEEGEFVFLLSEHVKLPHGLSSTSAHFSSMRTVGVKDRLSVLKALAGKKSSVLTVMFSLLSCCWVRLTLLYFLPRLALTSAPRERERSWATSWLPWGKLPPRRTNQLL